MKWWRYQMETVSALPALCGEIQWIPLTKASDAAIWCFRSSPPEQTFEYTIKRHRGMFIIQGSYTSHVAAARLFCINTSRKNDDNSIIGNKWQISSETHLFGKENAIYIHTLPLLSDINLFSYEYIICQLRASLQMFAAFCDAQFVVILKT